MKTLIFHIGTYKTGTTSLQELVYNNRDELESLYGICYPDLNADTSLMAKAETVGIWVRAMLVLKNRQMISG